MIFYEVYLEVAPEIYEEYLRWLPSHVEKMLTLPGFKKALILVDENRECALKVVYSLNNKHSLEDYFKCHAEAMRKEALEKFAGLFTAKRSVFSEWFC